MLRSLLRCVWYSTCIHRFVQYVLFEYIFGAYYFGVSRGSDNEKARNRTSTSEPIYFENHHSMFFELF
jgi:hypothetical protein